VPGALILPKPVHHDQLADAVNVIEGIAAITASNLKGKLTLTVLVISYLKRVVRADPSCDTSAQIQRSMFL